MHHAPVFIETRTRTRIKEQVVLKRPSNSFHRIERTASPTEYVETNLSRTTASFHMKRLAFRRYMPRSAMDHDTKTPQHPVFRNNILVH
jgi:hypothetical protein